MKSDIRVNRKFVFILVSIQILILALTMFALLAPKSVTVYVKEIQSSYQIETPLEIQPPTVN